MANSLYNALGAVAPMQNNPINRFVQEYNEFRRNFKGDPRAEVQKMLQSGQITQAQLDAAQATAHQLQGMLGLK